MFEGEQRKKRRLLSYALRNPSPGRISLSKREILRDYFSVYITDKDEMQGALVERVFWNHVEGLNWDGEKYSRPVCYHLDSLSDDDIDFIHYYKNTTISYHGWAQFDRGITLKISHLKDLRYNIVNYVRGRLSKVSDDRYQLLKKIIDHSLSRENFFHITGVNGGISAQSLMAEVYGKYWIYHPDKERSLFRTHLILDSLAKQGALSKKNFRYRLEPEALQIWAEYEMSERRHCDTVRQNRILIVLTIALVFATIGAPLVSKF